MTKETMVKPGAACTACGTELDAATDLYGDRVPEGGDITLCIKCGHILAFTDDLGLRDLTDDEMIKVAGHPAIVKAQKSRHEIMTKIKVRIQLIPANDPTSEGKWHEMDVSPKQAKYLDDESFIGMIKAIVPPGLRLGKIKIGDG